MSTRQASVTEGPLDLERMRRERTAKLHEAMATKGLDALFLLASGNVSYATGGRTVQSDNGRSYQQRPVALVVAGDPRAHLFTPFADGIPDELPADHRHGTLDLETDGGVSHAAAVIAELIGRADARVGVDDFTASLWFGLPRLLPDLELADAGSLLVRCRLVKTTDEVECMRRSWAINEAATKAAEEVLRPGVRLTDLSGAFLQRLFELGGTCNFLDPVWQAMPQRIADGPWSTNGDIPFNLVTTDHVVSEGEVIWTDTVMGYEGYASDVGRTWVVGRPTHHHRDLWSRWQEITDSVLAAIGPGVTGDVLTRVAKEHNGGTAPWLDHFFLAHGLGLEGGEPQQIGSDKGHEYDEQFVLEPGMAIVVEPVTWAEGHGGWRCEELVVVTDDGHERISRYRNEPFE
jgi:Xaa-Pro aminopeptidase